jgi:hypothetical protein
LLRAYRLTRYRTEGFDIFIGRRAPDALFVQLGARSATLVTAWNPLSHRMPDGWNRRMQIRLRERLRRVVTAPADGVLRRWHEAHVLVAGDPRRAARLARLYRQRGIVVLRRGRRTQLMVRSDSHQPQSRQADHLCANTT